MSLIEEHEPTHTDFPFVRAILRRILIAAAVILIGCGGAADTEPIPAIADPGSSGRPNIVVIVVDDLRWDEFGAAGHPWLETPNIDRLAREGAYFENSFHAVPLCSPNRATLLTGQFPSQHGIIDNVARSQLSHRLETFPRALQTVGYETAFLGKWHMGNDPTPRPGFDYWVGLPGQGRSVDPQLFEDGALRVVEGYTTDLLTDRAIAFIERERTGPFLIYLAHKAVHPDVQQLDDGSTGESLGYIPAPRHLGRYAERVLERRPSVVRTLGDLADRPAIQRALAFNATGGVPASFAEIAALDIDDTTVRRRAEMLLAVDEGIGRIIATLEARGELDRTVFVFTSDNGFFFGEHGLTTERRLPYEESIRNPLVIRYPPLVRAGSRPLQLALTVDLAPTLLDLGGAPIGAHIQGRSLVPVLRGDSPEWRTSILVEFYTYENPFPHLMDMDYRALRTDRYKYVHWVRYPELDELYDLESDPFEVRNIARDPAMAAVRSELRAELARHVLEALRLGTF
ncbi:MAG: sulfatase-like hydrolase/transferase [Gemmatimonadetes bacterium]|nr:sulfatase-like hydrolase/transferase [Gemmatimonadota bacterium]